MPKGIKGSGKKSGEPIVAVGGTEATKVTIKEAPKPDFVIEMSGEEMAKSVAAVAPAKAEKPKLAPPPAGQKYFETPAGELILGDENKDTMLYRPRDGRKPFFINPKR